MLFNDLTSDLTLFIPFVITTIAMIIVGAYIIIKDFKDMQVKVWALLLFPALGFLGVIIARLINGTFQWYFLLPIPIYIFLDFLNVKFNKNNKFIGQGDMDIFAGSLALIVPIIIAILTTTYNPGIELSAEAVRSANTSHLFSFLFDAITWLLVGYAITFIVHFGRYIIKWIKDKEKPEKGLWKRKVPVAIAYIPLQFYIVYAGIYLII